MRTVSEVAGDPLYPYGVVAAGLRGEVLQPQGNVARDSGRQGALGFIVCKR